MTKSMASIRYERAVGREHLFFSDPQADFYVLYEKKLYSLRKQFLRPSYYFSRKIEKNHRIHVLQGTFKSSTFEKVISCFYGLKCIYERGKETGEIMEIIKFIQCKEFQDLLRKEITKNFNEYEIFYLLDFASKYNDNQLQALCHQELIRQNFQQFNFNRYSLLNCRVEVFKSLIKLHQKLKRKGTITGLPFQSLRKIIVEYNLANKTSVDLLTVLTPPSSLIIMEDPEGEKDSPMPEKLKKFRRHQTIILNNSYNSEDFQFPFSNEPSIDGEDEAFSVSCIIERDIESSPQKNIKSMKELTMQKEKKESTNFAEDETQPQESLFNSEAISINATMNMNEKSQIEAEFGKFLLNNFQESHSFKKKRGGSITYAQNLKLINSNLTESFFLPTQNSQKDSKQRLIKSQTIQKYSGERK